MEKNNTVTPLSVLHEIEFRVIQDEKSPFKTMMRKAKDIDIDYFEKFSRNKGINKLSEELNLSVKDQVVEVFGKMADSYYVDGDLLEQMKALVFQEAEKAKNKKDFLITLVGLLEWYADKGVPSAGWSRYTNEDLLVKYKNAKEITLKEFLMGSNVKDILEFYSALMDNTWWACRELIVERTQRFLQNLSGEIRRTAGNLVDDGGAPDAKDVEGENAYRMELPEELMELAEQMAERVHDVWMEERIRQGWLYGEKRDDDKKKHPCLVPYDQLPEEEKVYDRNTSIETLKFIIKAGFEIKRKV